jgi:hypothetical protein
LEEIMTARTIKRTVSFARPFALGEFSEQFPAGRYAIETDEDMLDGMFYPTYLQGVTVMQKIAERRPGITEPVVINPFQLDAALALDAVLDSMAGAEEACAQIEPAAQEADSRDESARFPDIGPLRFVRSSRPAPARRPVRWREA